MLKELYDKNEYENYPSYLMGVKKENKTDMGYGAPSPINTFGNQQRFGTDAWKNATLFDTEEVAGKREMDITYDGDYLTANAYRISPKGDTLNHQTFKKRAYSGRSIGDDDDGNPMFDFSKEAQEKEGEGPLPEGNYSINPQKIQRYNPSAIEEIGNIGAGIYNKTISKAFGVSEKGNRPGGKYSWGAGLVDITADSTNNTKRGGFTIHGGCEPGSAGCIDLLDNDDDFFDFLDRNRDTLSSVPLKVDYSTKFK